MTKIIYVIACLTIIFQPQNIKAQEFDGTWESIGYGREFVIKNDNVKVYDITKISCIQILKGKLSDISSEFQIQGDTLSYQDGINTYYLHKINTSKCDLKNTKANDPLYNFDVLVETFKENYAYFKERGIDPDTFFAKYRSKLSETTSDVQLYLIIQEMLNEFEDGHIQFSASPKIEKSALTLSQKESEKKTPTPKRIRSYVLAEMVADSYLDSVKSKRGGTIRWGVIQDNIGYIQLNQMLGFGNYDINDYLSVQEYWAKYLPIISKKSVAEHTNDELNGIKQIMDIVMQDLKNTNGIIIDVRFNGGGKDEVGLEVLRRFNANKKVIGIKKAVFKDGYTKEQHVNLEKSDSYYSKPLVILTSKASASATETFAFATLSMDNATRIGSTTEGITSDMLDKTLPNGWEFSLSNEIYLDNNGVSYEHIGIPPNIVVYESQKVQEQYQVISDELKTKDDIAINKAIEIINK